MNSKSRKTVITFLIIFIAVVLIAFYLLQREGASVVYRTAEVDRGDISSYVSATGTINPITTAEIVSPISGTVEEVYADFNSLVEEGEALAKIDPAPFQAKFNQAQADLRKTEADAGLAETIMKANEELYEKRLISKQEYDDSRVKYSAAVANLAQARAALEIAKTDLEHTTVRSPIDGVVISKNVNVGQAVGWERKSPLFVVAEDLGKMKVDTYVSEADIGKIEVEQEAVFTVDAYPNQTFRGKVRQIRNEPITDNDVVTYDVVVLVDNEGLKLKPGMTAEVGILVAHKENALRVPRAALRFIPPPSAVVEETSEDLDSSTVVWMPAEEGRRIRAVPINPGVSGDTFTEILDGDLEEGQKVIVEAAERGESSSDLGPIVLPKPNRF